MISSDTFARNWDGPDFNSLNKKGPLKNVNLKVPKSINQFFTRNADNYISRHDISLFKKWSVNVVHTALMQISDNSSRHKFVIYLLRPHPNDNNKRFILAKTFRKLSKDADGLKWNDYFECGDFIFDQKDALKLFIEKLEEESMKLQRRENQNKRKRKRIKIEDDDDNQRISQHSTKTHFVTEFDLKMTKIKQILSTLNHQERKQALMELLMDMTAKQQNGTPSKRRRISSNCNDTIGAKQSLSGEDVYNTSTESTTSSMSLPSPQSFTHSTQSNVFNDSLFGAPIQTSYLYPK